jgi:hypothetical protein
VALGLLSAELADFAELGAWLGRMPRAFCFADAVLAEHANLAVSRHGEARESFPDLRAKVSPASFGRFEEAVRGLIEAPLVVAEIALGLRPALTTRATVQLLHCMQFDPGLFESALPAALAWHETRAQAAALSKRMA